MTAEETHPTDAVKSVIAIKDKPQLLDTNDTAADKGYFRDGIFTKAVIFTFIAFALLIISWLWLTPTIVTPSTLTPAHSQGIAKSKTYLVSFENQQLKKTSLAELVSNQTLFDSPYSTWQQHSTNDNQLLVAIKLYSVQDKKALRFHIQGEKHGWHDYILAANEEQAISQLNSLLLLLLPSRYFSIASTHEALAKLTILISEQPAHELLNQQLIKQTFKLNDLDRATAIIKQQLAAQPTRLRQGLLNLLKTDITMKNKHWPTAKESISQALTIFKELQLPRLEARALIELSWIYFVDKEFRLGMQVLNQAAIKARESNEPLLEVNAHIIQSFLASKAGQNEMAHTQLDLAKEIIEMHQLSEEHQIAVLSTLGWIATSPIEALPHYQKCLTCHFLDSTSPIYMTHLSFYVIFILTIKTGSKR